MWRNEHTLTDTCKYAHKHTNIHTHTHTELLHWIELAYMHPAAGHMKHTWFHMSHMLTDDCNSNTMSPYTFHCSGSCVACSIDVLSLKNRYSSCRACCSCTGCSLSDAGSPVGGRNKERQIPGRLKAPPLAYWDAQPMERGAWGPRGKSGHNVICIAPTNYLAQVV